MIALDRNRDDASDNSQREVAAGVAFAQRKIRCSVQTRNRLTHRITRGYFGNNLNSANKEHKSVLLVIFPAFLELSHSDLQS